MMSIQPLPLGFRLVRVKDGELELCPGVRLATTIKLSPGQEVPRGVAYCYVKKDAPFLKGIKQVPYHLVDRLPEIRGCVPLLLPPNLLVASGIRLVLGAMLAPGIELPTNVYVVYISDFPTRIVKLPKGMKEISLSPTLKTPDNFRLPRGRTTNTRGQPNDSRSFSLILAQMHTSIMLPSGVEVSPGCEITEFYEDISMPYGVQVKYSNC